MDSLRELRAGLLQKLLEQCQSIKVKRLFIHLAKECGHKWLQKIEVKKINLGKGTRQIAKGTYYDKELDLYVPNNPLQDNNSDEEF